MRSVLVWSLCLVLLSREGALALGTKHSDDFLAALAARRKAIAGSADDLAAVAPPVGALPPPPPLGGVAPPPRVLPPPPPPLNAGAGVANGLPAPPRVDVGLPPPRRDSGAGIANDLPSPPRGDVAQPVPGRADALGYVGQVSSGRAAVPNSAAIPGNPPIRSTYVDLPPNQPVRFHQYLNPSTGLRAQYGPFDDLQQFFESFPSRQPSGLKPRTTRILAGGAIVTGALAVGGISAGAILLVDPVKDPPAATSTAGPPGGVPAATPVALPASGPGSGPVTAGPGTGATAATLPNPKAVSDPPVAATFRNASGADLFVFSVQPPVPQLVATLRPGQETTFREQSGAIYALGDTAAEPDAMVRFGNAMVIEVLSPIREKGNVTLTLVNERRRALVVQATQPRDNRFYDQLGVGSGEQKVFTNFAEAVFAFGEQDAAPSNVVLRFDVRVTLKPDGRS